MTQEHAKSEFDSILQCIALFGDGASVEQITHALCASLSRRTLQRRLAWLVKNEYVLVEGLSRRRKYRLKKLEKEFLTFPPLEEIKQKTEDFIPLSTSAKEIQRTVCLPTHVRPHVSYQRSLLDEYQPNITNYLSTSLVSHLKQLGKTDGPRPAGTYAQQIYGRLLIDLSWNSSRLEGNTYSLLETERLLELSEIAEGKNLKETQMIMNHKAALEFLVESARDIGINRYTILNLHSLLSNNLLGHPESCGRLRKIPVGITETVYQPTAIPHLIEECFQNIISKANKINNPFEQAFFLMVHIPYLQPFEDVNKRVSRLAANIPLIRHNLCPLSFVDVPNQIYINGHLGVYELARVDLLRDVFVWAYERSCLLYSTTCQSLGEPDPFRMQYRDLIYETVTHIIRERLTKKAAIEAIKQKGAQIQSIEDRGRFIQSVEVELRGLHEGNIARYRLRPSEFDAWHTNWQ
jgi:hypothetical protein